MNPFNSRKLGLLSFWILSSVFSPYASIYSSIRHVCAGETASEFSLPGGKLRFDLPSGWQGVLGGMGVPLMLVGPMKNGTRPIISVTLFEEKNLQIDFEDLNRKVQEYRDGRKKWLQKQEATLVSFLEPKLDHWSHDVVAYELGFYFKMDEDEFLERSNYVTCKRQFVHLKSVLRVSTGRSSSVLGKNPDTVVRIMKSITCD